MTGCLVFFCASDLFTLSSLFSAEESRLSGVVLVSFDPLYSRVEGLGWKVWMWVG